MKVNIRTYNRNCGNHTTITDEPYASALANIDGLATATNNATYRGVRFGRERQRKFAIYFGPNDIFPGWWEGENPMKEEWRKIQAAGAGIADVPQDVLDRILAASAAIDAEIARVTALPHVPTYTCAGHVDGCMARVTVAGSYCRSCAHDNE